MQESQPCLLDLPPDIVSEVLAHAAFQLRRVCKAFRTHIDAGRTSLTLSSLTTSPRLCDELPALLARMPKLIEVQAVNTLADSAALAHCTRLQSLSLAGRLEVIDADKLAACQLITSLQLGTYPHEQTAPVLAGRRALEWLHIIMFWPNTLQTLAACTRLTTVSLPLCINLRDISALASCARLRLLTLTSAALEDLATLAACTHLTALSLRSCGSLQDLGPLAECTGLRSLDLGWCTAIKDVAPLAACVLLTVLDLDACTVIGSLAALSSCTALQRLTVVDRRDLDPLLLRILSVTSLSIVALARSQISFVAPLCRLTELDLSHTLGSVVDISPLTSCLQLASLILTQCPNIRCIACLTALTDLRLLTAGLSWSDALLLGVAACTRLKQLRIEGSLHATDISLLVRCTGLESLHIVNGMRLVSLHHLSSLTLLTALSLNHCIDLADVSPLTSCTRLSSLSLRRCRFVADIRVVAALPLLQHVCCSEVAVVDLAHLASCPNLEEVVLIGCQSITDVRPLAACAKLRHLNVSGCGGIADVSALQSAAALTVLVVGCPRHADLNCWGDRVRFRVVMGYKVTSECQDPLDPHHVLPSPPLRSVSR